jgi:hypothetical protein
VLLFSIVAIVCTGDGLRRGSAPRLFLGAMAAVAATCSMSHGCLTWLAMAWQAAVARRPRPWLGAVAAIIGVTCIAILANSSQSGAPLQVEPIITALLIAIGTGLVGLVHNQPVPNLNLAAGALVAALASAAAFSLSKMDPDVRDRVNESSGLMLLGALSATALAFGRGAFGPDYMASSRYAAIVMPLAAGVYLFWLARPHRGFKLALPLATALVLAGEGLTNYEEAQMAPHRAHYLAETAHVFRCAPTDSPAALARTIVDMRDDYLVGRPFLESGRLSIYGLPFACDVP